jgi:hypothetical protein
MSTLSLTLVLFLRPTLTLSLVLVLVLIIINLILRFPFSIVRGELSLNISESSRYLYALGIRYSITL